MKNSFGILSFVFVESDTSQYNFNVFNLTEHQYEKKDINLISDNKCLERTYLVCVKRKRISDQRKRRDKY